ncbi:MAG: D-alanyl-D-alanine carboxypeptidase [Proteobacteria bacterium]|nr:D-alanyl-D-alanine carboxypeptidase [Pseudomonadota bacterium]
MPSPVSRIALAGAALLISSVALRADPMVPTVIVDAATGEVLHSEEATRPWFPASTTKLMTAYVALRAVEQGLIKFDTPIVVSAVASKQPPSKIGLKAGQEITLENALKIIMVKSANDVSTVIAEGIGGSTAGFSAMMNREAARLGMRESHFVNPHGLHQEGHVSSARDMALLARALLVEFPHYRDLWGIGAVQLGQRKFANTNGLVGRYPGAMGMKTGFVCASGFNLVSAAERNGRTLIAVVFGATTGADRTLKAAQLLDQGFSGGGFSLFGGRSGGMSLAALPTSSERIAPNRRAEICGRRGAPASEEDSGAAMSFNPSGNTDKPDMLVGFSARALPAHGVGQRVGNQIALGPRTEFDPIPVYIGRKPGSTEIARRPGGEPVQARSQAFAPEAKRNASGNPLALTAPLPGAGRIGQAKAAPPRPAAGASLANRANLTAPPLAPARNAASAKAPEKKVEAPRKKKIEAKARPRS